MSDRKSEFGVFGLGVMGSSISLNIADKGYELSVFNRADGGEERVVDDFMNSNSHLKNLHGYTDLDAFICTESFVTGSYLSDQQRDLKDIVDGLLSSLPSGSLGKFPTSRLMMQVKPKLVEANDDYIKLDTCDVVSEGFTRVCRKGDES